MPIIHPTLRLHHYLTKSIQHLIKKWIRGRADQPDFWGFDQMRHLEDIIEWLKRHSSRLDWLQTIHTSMIIEINCREDNVIDDRIRPEADIVHKILSGWNQREVTNTKANVKSSKHLILSAMNESSLPVSLNAKRTRARSYFYFPLNDPELYSPLMAAILSDYIYRSRAVTVSSDQGYFLSSADEVDRAISFLKASIDPNVLAYPPIILVTSTSYEETYLQEWLLYHLTFINVERIILLLSKPYEDRSNEVIKPFLHLNRVSVVNMSSNIGNETCFDTLLKIGSFHFNHSTIYLSVSEFLYMNESYLRNLSEQLSTGLLIPVIDIRHNLRVAMHPGEIVTQDFTYRHAHDRPSFRKLDAFAVYDSNEKGRKISTALQIYRYYTKSAESFLKRWILAHWDYDVLQSLSINQSSSCLFREHLPYLINPTVFVDEVMNTADSHYVDDTLQEKGAKIRAAILRSQK